MRNLNRMEILTIEIKVGNCAQAFRPYALYETLFGANFRFTKTYGAKVKMRNSYVYCRPSSSKII